MDHPPYSLDVAPAIFGFPKLKNSLKGQTFADIPDIQANVSFTSEVFWKIIFQDFSAVASSSSEVLRDNGSSPKKYPLFRQVWPVRRHVRITRFFMVKLEEGCNASNGGVLPHHFLSSALRHSSCQKEPTEIRT
jgi:hypothetical protein